MAVTIKASTVEEMEALTQRLSKPSQTVEAVPVETHPANRDGGEAEKIAAYPAWQWVASAVTVAAVTIQIFPPLSNAWDATPWATWTQGKISGFKEMKLEKPLEDRVAPSQSDRANLAASILAIMRSKNYKVREGKGRVNIVYLRGADADGTPNSNKPDHWNDRRIVLEVVNGIPTILLNVQATVEPGIVPASKGHRDGLAHVPDGQQSVWVVGKHGSGSWRHDALVQKGKILVLRDVDRDGTPDKPFDNAAGINQHGGSLNVSRVGKYSVGCLVGQSMKAHEEFMKMILNDPDYLANKSFRFPTTVISAKSLQSLNSLGGDRI